jgi:hypothetical protein
MKIIPAKIIELISEMAYITGYVKIVNEIIVYISGFFS